jgi:hypothetical protein
MFRNDLIRAFAALGARLGTPAEIVVAGGSALLLLGIVDRSTADADAVSSHPKLSTFSRDVSAVADELGLAPGWLNDGVSAYRGLLSPDFASRTVILNTFGRLTVRVLGRADLILMKMADHETSTTCRCWRQLRRKWRSSTNSSRASIRSRHATPSASNSISSSISQHPNAHDRLLQLHHTAG